MFPPAPQVFFETLTKWLTTNFDYPNLTLSPLSSERDLVALVKQQDQPFAILKVANPGEDFALLDAQVAMHQRLSTVFGDGCKVIPNRQAKLLCQLTDELGRECWVRLLSFVPGRPVAEVGFRSPKLLQQNRTIFGKHGPGAG